MRDILPDKQPFYQFIERTFQALMKAYGYQGIGLPLLEKTELFKRTIGEHTDVVEKEMYTFVDRHKDQLSLRPEGTAGCVRAGIEKGLFHNQLQRLWYLGPMFRHERPQKGRYRQFTQLGVETYGFASALIDVELILIGERLWKLLALSPHIELQVNTLGNTISRLRYREKIIQHFEKYQDLLDPNERERLVNNPLRLLDSKNPKLQSPIAEAPKIKDYLDLASQQHFDTFCESLEALGVKFKCYPHLVRGLDYYTDTVFEWVTASLGAQGTVCAGGRYDGLVERLGGQATPAAGFAAGLDRIVLLLEAVESYSQAPDIYMVLMGSDATQAGLKCAEQLRNACASLSIETHLGTQSFKSQLKRADKVGARWAIIIGEDELSKQQVVIKDLRQPTPQMTASLTSVVSAVKEILKNETAPHWIK